MTAPDVRLEDDRIRVGRRLAISFQRTLRVPDDGRTYPLPPGFGRFPLRRCVDYADRLPRAWRDDLFIPMYRREALWIAFEGAWWRPNAVKVGVGGIDAVAGDAWSADLRASPQNYLVVPDQPWLDGINAGSEWIRQFVAMPMGEGHSVEAQITGAERRGGLQILAFEPRPGRFPDEPPPPAEPAGAVLMMPQRMGVAAGGRMRQKIYPDAYGIDTWDPHARASAFVHLFASDEFAAITRERAPATPVDAAAYTAAGLPWFELYDDAKGDVAAAGALARIRSIREIEESGLEKGVDVDESQIRRLAPKKPRN
jgi:hypothetical protein